MTELVPVLLPLPMKMEVDPRGGLKPSFCVARAAWPRIFSQGDCGDLASVVVVSLVSRVEVSTRLRLGGRGGVTRGALGEGR
jgi:hypothetical protein